MGATHATQQTLMETAIEEDLRNETTFQPNRNAPIHRWYPYTEGFSGEFIRKTLHEFKIDDSKVVLDPFAGCGTTLVESTLFGIDSIGVDVNPFICSITKAKTQLDFDIAKLKSEIDNLFLNLGRIEELKDIKNGLSIEDDLISYYTTETLNPLFHDRPYFSKTILNKILILKEKINKIDDIQIRNLFLAGLSSILVIVSNLRRGPDLAYKKKPLEDAPVYTLFREKILEMFIDIKDVTAKKLGNAKVYEGDAKDMKFLRDDSFDFVITSPPYLNGTNYSRNTKLEMWVLDFISKKEQLHELRRREITAGINATHFTSKTEYAFPEVDLLVQKINENAYDRRIPHMVSGYFNDIFLVLREVYRVLDNGGYCIWVVGDSMYGGVHIPTHELTSIIAGKAGDESGFLTEEIKAVRERRSRGGFKLNEYVLVMRKK